MAILPGQVEYASMDLTPGNYVLVCDVVDPASGRRHREMGMTTPFAIPDGG